MIQNEEGLIAELRKLVVDPAALDLDDDAAVLPGRHVITSDMLIEDVDFRISTFSFADIGHKALAENLSDLAAMGATPRWFTLNLAAPKQHYAKLIDIAREAVVLGNAHGCMLIGGDLSASPVSVIVSITAGGDCQNEILRRRTARVGDRLFVGRTLGGAAAGLHALERRLTETEEWATLQRRPQPQVELGLWLSKQGAAVRGAMDLSDGLASDLKRFLPRHLGADISQLPVTDNLRRFSTAQGLDVHDLAMTGGEEFCLLFATSAGVSAEWLASAPCVLHEIGVVTDTPLLTWRVDGIARPWPLGFDHFSQR